MLGLIKNPLKRSDLDELESPAVASHPLRVNCYFGGKHGSQSCGYSGSRSGFSALIEGRSCKSQDCFGDTPKTNTRDTGGQAVRYPAVSVVSQVLRLRQVSAVRRLRMLDDREIFVRNCEYVVFGE